MRSLLFVLAACVLASACSTRAMRPHEDLWSGEVLPGAAAFMDHDDLTEPDRPLLPERRAGLGPRP
jgi:hypothetical protein